MVLRLETLSAILVMIILVVVVVVVVMVVMMALTLVLIRVSHLEIWIVTLRWVEACLHGHVLAINWEHLERKVGCSEGEWREISLMTFLS